MIIQVVFSKAILADTLQNVVMYDKVSIQQFVDEIESQAIKNMSDRTCITVGSTKIILATLEDVIKAKGDDDD